MNNIQFDTTRDINNVPGTTLSCYKFSDSNQDCTLTAGDITTVVVPANLPSKQYVAIFTYTNGADVFVLPSATPTLTLPTGTVRTTTAQFRPKMRLVSPGQTLQLLYSNASSNVTTVSVSISYYAFPFGTVIGL